MLDVYTYSKRVAITAAIVLLVASCFYMLARHGYFFLLVFAAVLLAVLFCGISNWIQQHMHLKWGLSLTLSILLVFGLLAVSVYFLAPTVGAQIQEMRGVIPQAIEQVQEKLAVYGWGKKVAEQVPDNVSEMLPEQDTLFSRLSRVFSTTVSILADLVIVIVTAIFLSVNPKLYTVGFSKLFAVRHRSRVVQVLGKCYLTLKSWLVAMLMAMSIIGVSTAIAFNLLEFPMAFALAFISFLFAFVPNIGPWIAAIPIGLVGLTVSPQESLYALLIYFGIQLIESYAITPLIFQRAVDLPPALLLFFQVILGILEGGLGLFLAAPLLAVLMVVVNELYIHDFLEGKPLHASEEVLQEDPLSSKE